MTYDEIQYGEKLIAKFVNFEIYLDGRKIFLDEFDHYKFHLSWDWLMQACYKWDNMVLDETHMTKYIELCDELDNVVALYEIQPAFETLVKCLTYYNTVKGERK